MSAIATSAPARTHTIGAVRELLCGAFPDISISKIRYLEDRGLVRPKRSRGGYRTYSDGDVERLATVLRLQRDEFLPLEVIRGELDTPRPERERRKPPTLRAPEPEIDLAALCERASITPQLARQLEEYDLLRPRIEGGNRFYRSSDAEIAAACGWIARHGLDARHLRTFQLSAGRQAALMEQLVATGLRSRDPDRRGAALDDLDGLAAVASSLTQLLLVRDLKEAASR